VDVQISQRRQKFTDFCSRFIRRVSGGLFSVKVAAVKRKANQSFSVKKKRHFIFYFLERLPAVLVAGLSASGMAY